MKNIKEPKIKEIHSLGYPKTAVAYLFHEKIVKRVYC